MSFNDKEINNIRMMYKQSYMEMVSSSDNKIGEYLSSLASNIWEALKDSNVLSRIEYNPFDALGVPSIHFYMVNVPGDYLLKLWYNAKMQKFMIGFFRQLSGGLLQQIPSTFNDEGLATIDTLDDFISFFTSFLARDKYNVDNKQVYKKDSD